MGCSTTINSVRAHRTYARGDTPSVSVCSIGLCGGPIPTTTGRLSDQYWSRRGVVLVTHADQY